MKFSIIVVALNAGEELRETVESIRKQTFKNIEIIVKDGCSNDGSLAILPQDDRLRVISQKDSSIYDGMNQSIDYINGEFALFMNCGDCFYSDDVLQMCADYIEIYKKKTAIYYGDCYTVNRDSILKYPEFSDYLPFSMVLCHQATFYSVSLIKSRKFALTYKMAADFEYYVNAYKRGVPIIHLPVTVANYKGNGASETTHNRRVVLEERKIILKENYSIKDYRKMWLKNQLRGGGIKRFLVTLQWFYPTYKKIAQVYYRKNKN